MDQSWLPQWLPQRIPQWLPDARKIPRWAIAPAVFVGLTVAALHAVLFQRGNIVLSSPGTDLILQFLPWREFGFGQMRQGNFPLWNPFVFGGAPYFAGFQSALLYPPNWLHLLLPLTTAINWIIAIHLFAAGYFTYLWCRGRHASIGASILAGIMFMFSGPYFLHIYAGHLPHLCVMVWVPLLLLSIDKLNETGAMHWCLLGVLAVAMEILGGHPQYLYYTGIATFFYTAITLIRSKHRLALSSGFVIIFIGASLLAAVQLLAGLQAAGESARSSGTDFAFASMFPIPPENFLTFFAPNLFGKLRTNGDPADVVTYFGRCYLWEMSVFMSITGVVLAVIGVIAARRKASRLREILFAVFAVVAIAAYALSLLDAASASNLHDVMNFVVAICVFICAIVASGFDVLLLMIVITATLALGNHLPFYRALYNYLPEYDHFRGVAKWTFPMCLFICPLAARGFDVVLARAQAKKIAAWITAGLAILFAAWAIATALDHGPWHALLNLISNSHELYIPVENYAVPSFIKASQINAAHALAWAAATLAAVFGLLWTARWKPVASYGLIALAALEMLVFAHQNLATAPPDLHYPDAWLSAIRATTEPADFRVANSAIPPNGGEIQFLDAGMSLGFRNIWGYDPGVLKRYAETLAFAQGIDPDHASQYLQITRGSPGLFQMLRCRLALDAIDGRCFVQDIPFAMPVAQLVPHWVVEKTRDTALAMINSNDFDPRKTVILETPPGINETEDNVSGPAEVAASSTDWIEIRTTIPAPNLLLITNNYSTGWRVVPIEPSGQASYQILPANHTLMAIPLQAGTHHLRIEYLPMAFRVGKWISIFACVAYAGTLCGWVIARWRKSSGG